VVIDDAQGVTLFGKNITKEEVIYEIN